MRALVMVAAAAIAVRAIASKSGTGAQADTRPEDGDNARLAPLASGPVPQSGMRTDLMGFNAGSGE